MPGKRLQSRDSMVRNEVLARTAIEPHQLLSVLQPEVPTAEIIDLSREFAGRPAPKANPDPDLARWINDRLSKAVHVRVA